MERRVSSRRVVVVVPSDIPSPYTVDGAVPLPAFYSTPEGHIEIEKKSLTVTLLDKLISIRSLLLGVTLFIVVAMGVGLISISSSTQTKIVNNLAGQIQAKVSAQIEMQIYNLFTDIDASVTLAETMFKNKTVPPADHEFLLTGWAKDIMEPMWTIIRKRPEGCQSQFQFLDGRMVGVESYDNVADVYWEDVYDGIYNESGWLITLNQTISETNYSMDNQWYQFVYPVPYDTWYFDPNRTVLRECGDPHYWMDLTFFYGEGLSINIQPCYALFCNDAGEQIGFFDISATVGGMAKTLSDALEDLTGKAFIIDDKQQIVASSTNSSAFNASMGDAATQYNVTTTDEVWIRDVAKKLNGNYQDHSRTEVFNGTKYFVNVKRYSHDVGKPYTIISILQASQFLAETDRFHIAGISAAVGLSVISLIIMFLVVFYITKPLFALARNLHKMAQLDLDIESMKTPRLFEVGKLHKSFKSMYAALSSFKKFVPVSIIKNIINTSVEVKSNLVPRNITIVFQDIQAFTGLAETMDPTTLAQMTGEYMEAMTEILCAHSATIDKYIGDCIMSLFNAPEDVPNHAEQATAAAVECLQVLREKNVLWKKKYGQEMYCRFGINTGECLVGNLGGVHRMNYTAIGDHVNIAARLETANKFFGCRIIVSKSVFKTLPMGKFLTRKLAKVRVSGKQIATTIYEVSADPQNPTLIQVFQLYESALRAHCKQNFVEADEWLSKALEICPTDYASSRLLARNKPLIQGVPADWDCIEDLSK